MEGISILIGLLVFVVVYVIAKFLLKKVDGLAELVEVLSLLIAAVVVYLTRGFYF